MVSPRYWRPYDRLHQPVYMPSPTISLVVAVNGTLCSVHRTMGKLKKKLFVTAKRVHYFAPFFMYEKYLQDNNDYLQQQWQVRANKESRVFFLFIIICKRTVPCFFFLSFFFSLFCLYVLFDIRFNIWPLLLLLFYLKRILF